MVEFIKINNKKYEARNIKEILKEEVDRTMGFKVDKIQEVLIYDLILKNLTYRLTCEFFRSGLLIDNELDLLNVVVKREDLEYEGLILSKNDMTISLGVYKEYVQGSNEIESRYVFGRC